MKKRFFLSFILGLFISIPIVQAQSPNRANLAFSLSPSPIQVGQTLTIDLTMSSPDQKVLGIEAIVNYDSNYLELTGATGSSQFKTIAPGDGINLDLINATLASGGARVGFVTFDMAAEQPTASISGQNIPVGKLFFKTKKNGSSTVSIQDTSKIVTVVNNNPIDILNGVGNPTAAQIIYACTTLDFDQNGNVDIRDIQSIAAVWGTNNSVFDLDGNGSVDIRDIQSVAARWLEICQ